MFSYADLFRHWEKIFWILFAVIALSLVWVTFLDVIQFELFIILGLITVIVGAGKLSGELTDTRFLVDQDDINKKLDSIYRQLEKTFDLASKHKKSTEYRVHKLDSRRIDTDIKLEKKYRELVSKIIEIENKVNRLSKEMNK
jgi:hypothetical protein